MRIVMDRWTPLIIVALPLVIGILDVFLLYAGTNKATISYAMLKVGSHDPLVPLSVCYSFAVLMGHCFFPMVGPQDPTYKTLAKMILVLSPTIYALIVIGCGGTEIKDVHREALIGGGRWWFALYMIAVAVIGGMAGHFGLPQHLPPGEPTPEIIKKG